MSKQINKYSIYGIMIGFLSGTIVSMEMKLRNGKKCNYSLSKQYCNICKVSFSEKELCNHVPKCPELLETAKMLHGKGIQFTVPDIPAPETLFLASIKKSQEMSIFENNTKDIIDYIMAYGLRNFFLQRCIKCPACPFKQCSNWGNAATHYRRKHGLLPYPCNLCPADFSKQINLVYHIEQEHEE